MEDAKKGDKMFKEVRRELDKRAKKKRMAVEEEDIIEEMWDENDDNLIFSHNIWEITYCMYLWRIGFHCRYVDSNRMVSVKMGAGADDLNKLINTRGRRHAEGEKLPPGEPSMEMYLKLAENFMKRGQFEAALYNIGEAADFNPESPVSNDYSFGPFRTM